MRLTITLPDGTIEKVSIHAPREGCDCVCLSGGFLSIGFNSRTPGGVRQILVAILCRGIKVSIHAPREGCDVHQVRLIHYHVAVSIHAPREGCDSVRLPRFSVSSTFQFTHPGRGATCMIWSPKLLVRRFQFTHPGRGATSARVTLRVFTLFQFTHPGRGATVWCKVAYYRADKQA